MERKYLIIGLGKSGKAAASFLISQNKQVIAIEDNLVEDDKVRELKQKGLVIVKEEELDLKKIEKIVISPGIDPKRDFVKKARENNIEIISEIELGARSLKNYCIGITGTNGKTTLTNLLCHIFNENNKRAKALGNVGSCLTAYLENADEKDIVVLELSSFQLETTKARFLDAAVIINITADHLDRYDSFQDYVNAKLNIVNCLKKEKTLYITKKLLKSGLVLKNNINIKQIEEEVEKIAVKICLDLKIKKENILKAVSTFKKDKHRLEFVRELNRVYFYNDSKATNVDAVIYAVKKIRRPIILIVGGKDKGYSYKIWNKKFKNKVKYILAIGQSAKKIKLEITEFNVQIVKDLNKAIKKAVSLAQMNDCILFSPGCSSFDMFKNYEERGENFKKIVNNL